MTPPIITEIDDAAVGTITLNRPEAYNAITVELARGLTEALDELADRANVIVVRGAGGNFSAGGDFKELERLRAEGEPAMRELFEGFHEACGRIVAVPVPVIAAVEGYAMAGGFELMQACDFAVARADARIGDNHSNFGQVPGGGSSQRLPRLIGRQRALGLILTGDRITGEEAASWGLAYRAFPPEKFDEAVAELVGGLAAKSREALIRIKRLVYEGLELDLERGLQLELETVLEHAQSAAAARGIESFSSR
jgi:enoyl-CoA hydratase/carnithine racemase